jgi:plastocyanin
MEAPMYRVRTVVVLLGVLVVLCGSVPCPASQSGGGALLAESEGVAAAPESGGRHFLRWIGHFHPPITAFPIAMLVGAAAAEALRLFTKAAWLEGAGRWCVILGAAGAVIAAPLGWAFAVGRSGTWVLETHRWLGTCLAVLSVIVLVLSERRFRRNLESPPEPNAFRIALFLAAPLVMATGFFGGAMVYGLRAYLWNQPEHAHEKEAAPGSTAQHPSSQPASAAAATVTTITLTDEFRFKPASLTIPVGTTVRWTNASGDTHTVSTDPRSASDPKNVSTPAGAAPFNSGEIRPGGTFEHRFTVPGTYRYVCEPHEEMGMKGTIVVAPGQ